MTPATLADRMEARAAAGVTRCRVCRQPTVSQPWFEYADPNDQGKVGGPYPGRWKAQQHECDPQLWPFGGRSWTIDVDRPVAA